MAEHIYPPVFNGRLDYINEWRIICEVLRVSEIYLRPGYEDSRKASAPYTYLPYPWVLGDELPKDVMEWSFKRLKERDGVALKGGGGGYYQEVCPEQLFIDELNFNALGLTGEERAAVWEGVHEQVIQRLAKAGRTGRTQFRLNW